MVDLHLERVSGEYFQMFYVRINRRSRIFAHPIGFPQAMLESRSYTDPLLRLNVHHVLGFVASLRIICCKHQKITTSYHYRGATATEDSICPIAGSFCDAFVVDLILDLLQRSQV